MHDAVRTLRGIRSHLLDAGVVVAAVFSLPGGVALRVGSPLRKMHGQNETFACFAASINCAAQALDDLQSRK